jgi:hypothetical protein
MSEMISRNDPRAAPKSRPLSDFEECVCGFYHLKTGACSRNDCPENPATKKKRKKA